MKVCGRKVLVVGGGEVSERKVLALLREDARITVASRGFTQRLTSLGKTGKVCLKTLGEKASSQVIQLLSKSDLAIAATDDDETNRRLAERARQTKIPICVVDNPELCDFYFPATTDFGNLKIAVSTGGRRPAMASILRKRLEKSITNEDILQVELQDYIRNSLRSGGTNSATRKKIAYNMIRNKKLVALLRSGKLEEAKKIATEIVERF